MINPYKSPNSDVWPVNTYSIAGEKKQTISLDDFFTLGVLIPWGVGVGGLLVCLIVVIKGISEWLM